MSFPSSLPSFTGFTSSHTLAQDSHAAQHNSEQAEITALATKVGVDGSAVTSTHDFKLSGVSAGDKAASRSGTETLANKTINSSSLASPTITSPSVSGGTFSSPTITIPAISGPIITAGGSWAGSPTISTPVIADLTNSQHNHQNAAGGGGLSLVAVANPYKFRAYRGTAWTASTSPQKIQFDTEDYDTGGNYDNVTNYRFTAPISGFYHFSASIASAQSNGIGYGIQLYKNGSAAASGTRVISGFNTAFGIVTHVSADIQLIANDYIEIYYICGTSDTGSATTDTTWFSGHLISAT